MNTKQTDSQYCAPCILRVDVSPDITKCMQNTGGIEERSTFNVYKSLQAESEPNRLQQEETDINKDEGDKDTRHQGKLSLFKITLWVWMITSLLCGKANAGQTIEIPILIPQKHPVIMEIVDGINKGFEELGYSNTDIKTILMDGQGVPANISTMIDAAIQKNPPFIITITTGLSKTTVDKVLGTISIVFSGVTDPVGAGIVTDLNNHGKVTGASDLWPIEEQLSLIRRILPNAKSVGIIFRPSEPNSQFGMRIAREVATKLDIKLIERGVEDAKDVVAVLESILPQVDAIYIGPDNMTIESAKVIVESCTQANKPVFGGEPGTLEKGAVGIVSIQYFDLGRETAKLCEKILKGIPTEQIPIYVAQQGYIGINYDTASSLNLQIPFEVRQSATKSIGQYREPKHQSSNPINMIAVLLILALLLCVVVLFIWRAKKTKQNS